MRTLPVASVTDQESKAEPARSRAIPLFDTAGENRRCLPQIQDALDEVLHSGKFIGGPAVETFERAFAQYCGAGHAVGVANGTDALALALSALGIGPGDEVVTSAYSFIATAQAIARTGAQPVFVDIDSATYNLDPTLVERALTPRTKAILVVHLFGRCAPMRELTSIARRHGLPLVEDAAQAHGASIDGQRVGSFGVTGCFSFYPTKNLGALGDGGAVVTNDAELARRIRDLAHHDRRGAGDFGSLGTNSRLDALQAAALTVKLAYLDEGNRRRRDIARLYRDLLLDVPLFLPTFAPESAPHIFPIRVPPALRDPLVRHLTEWQIGTRIYYERPLPRTSGFAPLVSAEASFPNADQASGEVLALPLYPTLSDESVRHVCRVVQEFLVRALS